MHMQHAACSMHMCMHMCMCMYDMHRGGVYVHARTAAHLDMYDPSLGICIYVHNPNPNPKPNPNPNPNPKYMSVNLIKCDQH